jgi:hypothetical protein
MDDLEIKIALTYKVPENNLTLNGLLRGLWCDRDEIMRTILGRILEALEEKAMEDYPPDRYIRNGHQSTARNLRTSFGRIRHRLAQVVERKTGAVVCPLIERLKIEPYRQYQRESLEAPVGQAIHLSYRWATKETQRIRGQGPSKSTLWRRLQEVAESQGAWPSLKHRPFEFLMVDGTKVRLQHHGASLESAEMRWAWASEGVGKPFELVGLWVGQDWKTIRRDLSRRLNYGRLRMLFSDGGPGIEDNLRSTRMEGQRCVWHGHHDFRFLLYADKVKGQDQREFLELLNHNPLFHLRQAELETLKPEDEPLVRKLARTIRSGFRELLAALPETHYPKTRTYVLNFSRQALTFFDYWLDHQRWIPFTTNFAESAFSRVVNRVKRIGRRWSETGLLNWLTIAFRKIFHPALWARLWRQYLRLHRSLHLVSLISKYQWINAIT